MYFILGILYCQRVICLSHCVWCIVMYYGMQRMPQFKLGVWLGWTCVAERWLPAWHTRACIIATIVHHMWVGMGCVVQYTMHNKLAHIHTHNTPYTTHNTQRTTHNTQFTIHHTQYIIHNTQHPIHHTYYSIHNAQHIIRNTHHNTICTTNTTQHSTHIMQYIMQKTQHTNNNTQHIIHNT